ncbi:MAG: immunoglobulin domain-containing protein [Treponema sp.]|jgi:hypothetical protein|nr:immunoglobulin domain-containing protein [Treponema sp.]
MKSSIKRVGIIALAGIIAIIIAACGGGNAKLVLSGTVTIYPNEGEIFTGTPLMVIPDLNVNEPEFQWFKDETAVSEKGFDMEYYFPQEPGRYKVTAAKSGYNGSVTSGWVEVILGGDFEGTVSISPDNAGGAAVYTFTKLTAEYNGSEDIDLKYQWKKNTEDIGTNSNEFTPTEPGSYRVVLSATGFKPITSTSFVTVINRKFAGELTIAAKDGSSGFVPGVTLVAEYSKNDINAITVAYQWYKDTGEIAIKADGNEYETTDSNTALGTYKVSLSSQGYDTIYSGEQEVAYMALEGDVSVSADKTTPGAKLTASYANGSESVSYQWYKNGNVLNGETGNTYTTAAGDAGKGSYTVEASASKRSSKTSDPCVIDWKSFTGTLEIGTNPAGENFEIGVDLKAAYDAGSESGYAWQWYFNGTELSGKNSDTVTADMVGRYTVKISLAEYYDLESTVQVSPKPLVLDLQNKTNISKIERATSIFGGDAKEESIWDNTENGIKAMYVKSGVNTQGNDEFQSRIYISFTAPIDLSGYSRYEVVLSCGGTGGSFPMLTDGQGVAQYAFGTFFNKGSDDFALGTWWSGVLIGSLGDPWVYDLSNKFAGSSSHGAIGSAIDSIRLDIGSLATATWSHAVGQAATHFVVVKSIRFF